MNGAGNIGKCSGPIKKVFRVSKLARARGLLQISPFSPETTRSEAMSSQVLKSGTCHTIFSLKSEQLGKSLGAHP